MDKLAKNVIQAFKKMKANRHNWEDQWWDVTSYVLPRKRDVWGSYSPGDKRNQKVFDASPQHFNELLASALHSMLTNPSTNWFELRAKDQELQGSQSVKSYLQKATDKAHQLINNSNFHSEVHEFYLDLGCMGTSPFRLLKDPEDVFRFKCRPIYEYQVQEDHRGFIDTVYTADDLSVRQIIQRYGEKALPADKKEQIVRDMDAKFEVIHAVLPGKDAASMGYKGRKKYASIHVLSKFDCVLKESGFKTLPYMIARWNKLSDEVYGRSPAMKALPDIKMLNEMKKDTIVAAQLQTRPPLLTPDGSTYGPPKYVPGGLNYYRAGTKDRTEPMNTGSNAGVGLEIMNDVREQIRQAFYVDQLQLREGPQMTATEVNARVDNQLRLLGPLLGRLHNEFLQPLISRMLDIMISEGEMPGGMPGELANAATEVVFTSQIAKAQRMAESQKIDRLFMQLGPLVPIKPDIMDNFDFDKIVDLSVDNIGIPLSVMMPENKKAEMRKSRAEQQQKQAQQQDAMTEAEVVNKVK